jgi:hypothetical protein
MKLAKRLSAIPGANHFVITMWPEEKSDVASSIYLPLDRTAVAALLAQLRDWLESPAQVRSLDLEFAVNETKAISSLHPAEKP